MVITGRESLYADLLAYVSIFLMALFILSPLIIFNQWPLGHNDDTYIVLVEQFNELFYKGILYPRWVPDFCGGYGYPFFVFYQPGFFFLAAFFALFFHGPFQILCATLVFLFFLGSSGVYQLCKKLSDPFTGFFCAMLFLMTPYLYVDLYVRGALTELTGILLCPWSLYFLLKLRDRISLCVSGIQEMIAMTVALFAVIMAHPAVAMFFFFSFSVIVIGVAQDMKSQKKEFVFKALICLLMSFAFSSPYWLSAFQMQKYVDASNAFSGMFSANLHVVYPMQFFSPQWDFGLSWPGPHDEMPFQLGLPHFLWATIGVMRGKKNRIIVISYVLYLFFILLMSPVSVFLWEKLDFLQYVQFPWRILSVTALLQIICVSGMATIPLVSKETRTGRLIILGVLLISLSWYAQSFKIPPRWVSENDALRVFHQSKYRDYMIYAAGNEFLPKTASLEKVGNPRGNMPLILLDPPCEIVRLEGNSSSRLRYQITNKAFAKVTINQFYLPGWKVKVNGHEISSHYLASHLTPDGRIQFDLPKSGSYEIKAYYDEPPGWFWRNLGMGVAALGFLLFFWNEKRRTRKFENLKSNG